MKNFSAYSHLFAFFAKAKNVKLPFFRYKIVGHSMLPTLKPGQIVWVFTWAYLFSEPKVMDIVIFRSFEKEMVKRVIQNNDSVLEVVGDNKEDSLAIGPIQRKDLIGKVLLKANRV